MSRTASNKPDQVVRIECEDGRRFLVYNASVLGNPSDYAPDKWYARPYPVSLPLGEEAGEAFETAEEAERALRTRHARSAGAAMSA
jgi:hypothetical protein